MEIAGFITGIIALFISGIIAWKDYFSRFNVRIYCGNPRLEPGIHILKDNSTVTRFAVILPIYFVNTGAMDGIIDDIAITVKSQNNTWKYFPFFYTRYTVKTDSALGKKLTDDPANEPFSPIHLQSKEQVDKTIVFASLENQYSTLGENPLLPDKYTFSVQTSELVKKKYSTKLEFSISLNAEQVADLSKGHILIPNKEEIVNKRQQLK